MCSVRVCLRYLPFIINPKRSLIPKPKKEPEPQAALNPKPLHHQRESPVGGHGFVLNLFDHHYLHTDGNYRRRGVGVSKLGQQKPIDAQIPPVSSLIRGLDSKAWSYSMARI